MKNLRTILLLSYIDKKLCLEILFLIILLAVSSWVYLKPILDTPNNYVLLGGGDDSTYGLLAQRILRSGITGGYDLTFPPLLPLLTAFFYKFLAFSIEDAGRLVSSFAIILTAVPTYFLARSLFGIRAAVIAAILISTWPMSAISFGYTRPQALQTFMMASAFLLSLLALKKEHYILYFFSGMFWGLSYLTRFESWLPFPILILLTLTHLSEKKSFKITLLKIFSAVAGFLIITSSYLSYTHDAFGSWTINPRVGIDVVAPGGAFSIIRDSRGITTLAQLMISGEPQYYQYDLWHPDTRKWLIAFSRNNLFDGTMPGAYIAILNKYSQEIVAVGFLGILLCVLTLFRKKTRLFLLLLTITAFLYSSSNLIMRMLANLPLSNLPLWWENLGNLFRITFIQYRDSYTVNNLSLLIISTLLIYRQKKSFKALAKFFHQNSVTLYLPAALLIGNLPLLIHSIDDWYILWVWPLLIIYASYIISKLAALISGILKNNFLIASVASIFVTALGIYALGLGNYARLMIIRDRLYIPIDQNAESIIMFKKSGTEILADHGPGARVATFRTTPAFYAQGIPFFFIGDNVTPLEQVIDYFYKNNVDYIVAAKTEMFAFRALRPLLNPETKLDNWEILYIDPSNEKAWVSDTESNIMVAVWKRKE